MTIIATFTEGDTLTVYVDAWNVDNAVETMFEMGAITVTTKENA